MSTSLDASIIFGHHPDKTNECTLYVVRSLTKASEAVRLALRACQSLCKITAHCVMDAMSPDKTSFEHLGEC